jgi:hypothetical protein
MGLSKGAAFMGERNSERELAASTSITRKQKLGPGANCPRLGHTWRDKIRAIRSRKPFRRVR